MLLLVAAPYAKGDSYYWSVASGDWSLASNWGGISLPTDVENAYVVNGGTTAITLPGAVCYSLYLGDPNSAGNGTIQMSSGNLTFWGSEYLGNNGSGTFNQSGGVNNPHLGVGDLYLGHGVGSSGSYNLSGSGVLSVGYEYVGDYGAGKFTQSGGTNTIDGLYLCWAVGSSGSYNLSGSGVLSAAGYEYVGDYDAGTFTQSGGTNNVAALAGGLCLGNIAGSNGTYNLNGSGVLLGYSEYVGYNYGRGTFTQSSGSNTCNGNLYVGYNSSCSGSYTLGGSGALSAGTEYVGSSGTGTFTQSGGSNTCNGNLYVGYNSSCSGSYTLGGSGALSAGTEYVGSSGTGTFTQSGGSNTCNGNLYVGYNSSCSGSYTLGGLAVLSTSSENVGYFGTGTFTQSGGTNTILNGTGALYIGYSSNSSSYNLSGSGVLSAGSEYVGNYSGTGTFTQSGGENMVASVLLLGGTFNLTGGALLVPRIQGPGVFNLGGGTLIATGSFPAGAMTLTGSGGSGNIDTGGYTVSISGRLSGSGGLNKWGAAP